MNKGIYNFILADKGHISYDINEGEETTYSGKCGILEYEDNENRRKERERWQVSEMLQKRLASE